MMRLTYDSGAGITTWEKTLDEFLVPNGDESLLVYMIRELERRGAYFRLESLVSEPVRHLPTENSGVCAICDRPWPCPEARQYLRA